MFKITVCCKNWEKLFDVRLEGNWTLYFSIIQPLFLQHFFKLCSNGLAHVSCTEKDRSSAGWKSIQLLAEAATLHPMYRPAKLYGESAECLTVNPYASIHKLLPPPLCTSSSHGMTKVWHWRSSLAFKEKNLILALRHYPDASWHRCLYHCLVL